MYILNTDCIKENLELNKYLNPSANDFHNTFIEQFKIEPNEELLKLCIVNLIQCFIT